MLMVEHNLVEAVAWHLRDTARASPTLLTLREATGVYRTDDLFGGAAAACATVSVGGGSDKYQHVVFTGTGHWGNLERSALFQASSTDTIREERRIEGWDGDSQFETFFMDRDDDTSKHVGAQLESLDAALEGADQPFAWYTQHLGNLFGKGTFDLWDPHQASTWYIRAGSGEGLVLTPALQGGPDGVPGYAVFTPTDAPLSPLMAAAVQAFRTACVDEFYTPRACMYLKDSADVRWAHKRATWVGTKRPREEQSV